MAVPSRQYMVCGWYKRLAFTKALQGMVGLCIGALRSVGVPEKAVCHAADNFCSVLVF